MSWISPLVTERSVLAIILPTTSQMPMGCTPGFCQVQSDDKTSMGRDPGSTNTAESSSEERKRVAEVIRGGLERGT